jgi:hypothetical protein
MAEPDHSSTEPRGLGYGGRARERNCDSSIEKVFAVAEWMGFLAQGAKAGAFHNLARRLLECDEILENWK